MDDIKPESALFRGMIGLAPMVSVKPILALGSLPDRYGFFEVMEQTEAVRASINDDSRLPLLPLLVPTDTHDAANAVAAARRVAHVRLHVNHAQIGDPVIAGVTVDMVDIIRWPLASRNGEGYAMRSEHAAKNRAIAIAARVDCRQRGLACITRVPRPPMPRSREHLSWPYQPNQRSRAGVVSNQLPKRFDGDRGFCSHSVSNHVGGQGRRGVSAPFRPALSSRFVGEREVA